MRWAAREYPGTRQAPALTPRGSTSWDTPDSSYNADGSPSARAGRITVSTIRRALSDRTAQRGRRVRSWRRLPRQTRSRVRAATPKENPGVVSTDELARFRREAARRSGVAENTARPRLAATLGSLFARRLFRLLSSTAAGSRRSRRSGLGRCRPARAFPRAHHRHRSRPRRSPLRAGATGVAGGSAAGGSASSPAPLAGDPARQCDRSGPPERRRFGPPSRGRSRCRDRRRDPSPSSCRGRLARKGPRRAVSAADRRPGGGALALYPNRRPTSGDPRGVAHSAADCSRSGSRGKLGSVANARAHPPGATGRTNGEIGRRATDAGRLLGSSSSLAVPPARPPQRVVCRPPGRRINNEFSRVTPGAEGRRLASSLHGDRGASCVNALFAKSEPSCWSLPPCGRSLDALR